MREYATTLYNFGDAIHIAGHHLYKMKLINGKDPKILPLAIYRYNGFIKCMRRYPKLPVYLDEDTSLFGIGSNDISFYDKRAIYINSKQFLCKNIMAEIK